MSDFKDNVKVAIRIRPLSEKESNENASKCLSVLESKTILLDSKPEPRNFTYDSVAGEEVTQEEIFEIVGKPITSTCIRGYNGTIFAYGQTGAGKTFTIQGEGYEDYSGNSKSSFHLRGILPRCFEYLFSSISEEINKKRAEYLVKCSYLEIYQENINDLLDENPRNLQIREDMKKGVYVEGLIEETVTNAMETYELLNIGAQNRHVSFTSMNKESSRSHSVFTLIIESKSVVEGLVNFKTSRFHLIDLAGSERQKATDCTGERLKEAGMINKSLSALGNVINSLVDISEGKSRHVHYRDSKLTFLLKDSLGGNSKTFIIANVSQAVSAFAETLSTLKFAQRAKMIKNIAVVNEDVTGTVNLLKYEIKKLKDELSIQKALNVETRLSCPNCNSLMNKNFELYNLIENMRELEALLDKNTRLRISSEKQLEQSLSDKEKTIHSMKTALHKIESKTNHDKMVLKFRDATIARLQTGCDNDEIASLKKENTSLKEQVENNPVAAQLFVENEKLKAECEQLKKECKFDSESLNGRIRDGNEYTERLCDMLKVYSEEKEKVLQWITQQNNENNSLRQELSRNKAESEEKIQLLETEKEALIKRIRGLLKASENSMANFEEEENLIKSAEKIEEMLKISHENGEVTQLKLDLASASSKSIDDAAKIKILEEELNQTQQELSFYINQIESKESAVKQSQQEIENLTDSCEYLKSNLDLLQKQLVEKTEIVIENESTIKRLEGQLSELINSLNASTELTAECDILTKKIEELEKSKEHMRRKCSDLEIEKKKIEGLYEVSQKQEQVVRRNVKEIHEKLRRAMSELEEKKEREKEMIEKLDVLEEEKAKCKLAEEKVLSAYEDLQEIKLRETLLIQNVQILEKKNLKLQESIALIEMLKKEIGDLKAELEAASAETTRLKQENNEKSRDLEESKEKEKELLKIIELLENEKAKLCEAESMIISLRKTSEDLDWMVAESDSKLKQVENELIKSLEEFKAAKLIENGLKSKIEAQENNIKNLLKAEINSDAYKAEAERLKQQLIDSEKHCKSFEVLYEKAHQNELNEQHLRENLEAELGSGLFELEEKETRLSILNEKVKLLEEERVKLLELIKKLKDLAKNHEELKDKLVVVEKEKTRIEDLHKIAVEQGKKEKETASELHSKLVKVSNELAKEKEIGASHLGQLEEKSYELACAKNQLGMLKSSFEELQEKCNRFEKEKNESYFFQEDLQQREMIEKSISSELRGKLGKAYDEIRTMKENEKLMIERIQTVERENLDMAASVENLDDLKKALHQSKEQCLVIEQSLKSNEEALESVIRKENSTIMDLEKAQRELEQTKSQLARVKVEEAELTQVIQQKELENKKIQEKCAGLSKALEEIQEQYLDLEVKMDMMENKSLEIRENQKELIENIKELEKENDMLRSKTVEIAEESCHEITTLKSKINRLEESLSKAKEVGSKLSFLESSTSELVQKYEKLNKKNVELAEEKSVLMKKLNELNNENEDLSQELIKAKEKIDILREENKTKMEILKTASIDTIATRNEISMWKKCLEDKNQLIQELRAEVQKRDEDHTKLQVECQLKSKKRKESMEKEENSEIRYLNSIIQGKEKELKDLKEKGQEYYSQADEALESQRKELDVFTKRCTSLQGEVKKLKEELRASIKDRENMIEEIKRLKSDEYRSLKEKEETKRLLHQLREEKSQLIFELSKENDQSHSREHKSFDKLRKDNNFLKAQVERLNQELSMATRKNENLLGKVKGNRDSELQAENEKQAEEIRSLTEGLCKITDFVFSLPQVSIHPEETSLVESAITAIKSLAEQRTARETPSIQKVEDKSGKASTGFKSNLAHYYALVNTSNPRSPQSLRYKSAFK